jgi:hypothetical protein
MTATDIYNVKKLKTFVEFLFIWLTNVEIQFLFPFKIFLANVAVPGTRSSAFLAYISVSKF